MKFDIIKLDKEKVNYALILLVIFMAKMIIFDASIADSIIVLVLASTYGYTQYLKRFQPYNLDEEVRKDLIEVKTALSKLNMVQSTDKLKNQRYF